MSDRDLVVFDIECTCSDDPNFPRDSRETIEIGAVKLSNEGWDVVDEFDVLIKPVDIPILTPFCKDLTTITQEQVDNGVTFAEGLDKFQEWARRSQTSTPLYMTWGYFDKNHLVMESGKKNYTGQFVKDIQAPFCHINLKERFAQRMGGKPCGVSKALSKLNYRFTGTQHRGIDDSRNIARIAKFLSPHIGV